MPPPSTPGTDWFTYRILPGVSEGKPGLYEWRIEGIGIYIGRYTRIRRPKREYLNNVRKLIEERPYRRTNPVGFRKIHHALHNAWRQRRGVTLTLLENCDPSRINHREKELIRERATLNVIALSNGARKLRD